MTQYFENCTAKDFAAIRDYFLNKQKSSKYSQQIAQETDVVFLIHNVMKGILVDENNQVVRKPYNDYYHNGKYIYEGQDNDDQFDTLLYGLASVLKPVIIIDRNKTHLLEMYKVTKITHCSQRVGKGSPPKITTNVETIDLSTLRTRRQKKPGFPFNSFLSTKLRVYSLFKRHKTNGIRCMKINNMPQNIRTLLGL